MKKTCSAGGLAGIIALSLLATTASAADFPAQLDWSGKVSLTFPVAGVIERIEVQAGQEVKKGDLIAALNPTLYKAGVLEARADLDRLTQEHADATRDLDRVKELYARTVTSTTELDAAKLRFARAQGGLTAAQARMEKARRQLSESELSAPFDARVLARHAEPGQVITIPCQPAAVATLSRADEWLARAAIDPASAASLRLGGDAKVTIAGQTYPGRLRAITVQNDNRMAIEVALPHRPGLYIGAAAEISLP